MATLPEKLRDRIVKSGPLSIEQYMSEALSDSEADGAMIGRGSYGRPWIFQELNSDVSFKINNKIKKDIILNHLQLSLEHYGKEIGLKSFRKHLGWYSKSIINSNEFRFKIHQCEEEVKLKCLINDFF